MTHKMITTILITLLSSSMYFITQSTVDSTTMDTQVEDTDKVTDVVLDLDLGQEINNPLNYSLDYDAAINDTDLSEYFFYGENWHDIEYIHHLALKAYIVTINELTYTFFTDLSGSSYYMVGIVDGIENGQNVGVFVSKVNNTIYGFTDTSFTFTYEDSFKDYDMVKEDIQYIYEHQVINEGNSL